jgi:DNA-directed RNA polymerase subunit RPC12/RpoP
MHLDRRMTKQSPNVGITCERCKAPVPVKKIKGLSEEFSGRCPKCGHRAFYKIEDLKNIEQ